MRPLIPALGLALLACPSLAPATTIRIDASGGGDFLTIQEGLSAAVGGDTVLVAAGVYAGPGNRDLDFAGRAITLTSEDGPDATVIDCSYAGRAFYFHSGESAASVVSGFTIRNGESAEWGGGVFCESASPAIEACVIAGCRTGVGTQMGRGGGVYCSYSSITLTDCTFTGNWADEGAAMYAADSSPILTGCRLVANEAGRGGGGIRILRGGAGAHLTGCTLAGNRALTYGGGVYCCYSQPVITACTITGNAATNGGAIYGYEAAPTVTNTILAFSTIGAAVYCPSSAFTITGCCSFGNAGGDTLCGTEYGNVFADPAFCDTTGGAFWLQDCSPCLGSGVGGLDIGAWGEGCPCDTSTSVPDGTDVPALSVHPNPAAGCVQLSLTLPAGYGEARVTIYDLRGRVVRELAPVPSSDSGVSVLSWDGRDARGGVAPSGVYFARVEAESVPLVRKVVLLR